MNLKNVARLYLSAFAALVLLVAFQNCNSMGFGQPPQPPPPIIYQSVAVPELNGVFSVAQVLQNNYWHLHGANKNFKISADSNELVERVTIKITANNWEGCTLNHAVSELERSEKRFSVDADCWMPMGAVKMKMTSYLSDGRVMDSAERDIVVDQLQLAEMGPTVTPYADAEQVALMPTMVLNRTPKIKLATTLPTSLNDQILVAIIKNSAGEEICRGTFKARSSLDFRQGNPLTGISHEGGMVDCQKLSVSEGNHLEIQAWTSDNSILLAVIKNKFRVIEPQFEILSLARGNCPNAGVAPTEPELVGNGSLATANLPDNGMLNNYNICAKVKIPDSLLATNTQGILLKPFTIGASIGGPYTGWSQIGSNTIYYRSYILPVTGEPGVYRVNAPSGGISQNINLFGYVCFINIRQYEGVGYSALSNIRWFYVGNNLPSTIFTPTSFWQN